MHPAVEVANRGAEQYFICQQRLQIGRLLQPFVSADIGAGFVAKNERHFVLGQMCALTIHADVVGQFRGRHGLESGGCSDTNALVCYNSGTMGINEWIGYNWLALVQTGALAGGLLFTGIAVLLDARARRVGNLIQLTQQHRDLWERLYLQPELARILDSAADPARPAVTAEEEIFVTFLILHLSNTYYAIRAGFFQKLRGLRKDIERFFCLPIPRAVWEKVKDLQDESFVRFVESSFEDQNMPASHERSGWIA